MRSSTRILLTLALCALASGCSGVEHNIQFVEPLTVAIEAEATLGVVFATQDPDCDEDVFAELSLQALPALRSAGVVSSVDRASPGASTTSLILRVTVAEYESTGKFGRAMWGMLAGPAIVVASLELLRVGEDLPLATAVSSARSSGFGIFAGTDVETYQKTVENMVMFLRQPAR